jgi:hypothetical protein
MTFRYPWENITDIKVANYQMVAYELVQYNASGGTFTLTFPATPTHGEVVGIKNVAFDETSIAISSAFNVETPLGQSLTSFNIEQSLLSIAWSFDAVNSVWRLVYRYIPLYIPEPWVYTGVDLTIGTNTPVPVTFQTDFLPSPVFFQANAGNLECIRQFRGYFDLIGYFNFIATGNNQDGTVDFETYAVAGTPTLNQGFGLVGSSAVPRIGTFPEQRFLSFTVIADVGDIIGLRGTATGSMTVDLVSPSGVIARNI